MKRNLWSYNLLIAPVRFILTGAFVCMFLLACSHRPAPVQEVKSEVAIPFLRTSAISAREMVVDPRCRS